LRPNEKPPASYETDRGAKQLQHCKVWDLAALIEGKCPPGVKNQKHLGGAAVTFRDPT